MTGQLALDFGAPSPCRINPSMEAHARITRNGLRAAQVAFVEALVKQYPGRTSRDLATLTDGLDAYQIARRLDDLRKAGRVRKAGTAISATGFYGWQWWPVDNGRGNA